MADYGKLLSRIWTDPEFTSLDARSQQVYCLLISYSTRNLAGVLPLTLKRWAKCTKDATVDNLIHAINVLARFQFVVVDWDTEELLVRTYIRNDEVYRQPNLMTAARRFALQVESERLRWVLHEEFLRLPEHKEGEKTAEAAKALVDGLEPTPTEPIAEPFTEPFDEPPGVGGYLSGVRDTPSTHTSHLPPEPEDDTAPGGAVIVAPDFIDNPQRIAKRHPSSAAKTIVRQELGSAGYPRGTLERLAVQVDRLAPHHSDTVIRESLREWDSREGSLRPEWLESVLGDVVAASRGQSGNNGKPKHKLRVLADLAAQVRAQEQTQIENHQKAIND